ncbi:MAG: 50S ribosomal protein L4 [Deltaproteobacteria bacterium]|nr:50S ribosomal protein L4 [Deltaproteobacteria bacterium]
MAKVTVFNLKRESVGEIELSDEVFAREVNEGLLHEVVRAQLASRRSGNASTKGRSETNGTTKKMYKQKGTGSARHGDRGAPNFVGGGQSHGPKPRSYAFRPNRKARIGAMQSALALKLKEGRLTVVDAFELGEIKTKSLAGILAKLEVARGSLIVDGVNENLRLSVRNLDGHQVLPPEGVNVYDVLRHEHLVLTKSAAQALEARLKG